MRFAPSPEQVEFARNLRDLLAKSDTPAVVRAWAAGDTSTGRALWSKLADAGVTALGTSEDLGGFGATPVDLVLAFEELGRAAVPGPYVESVAVVPALLAGTDADDRIGPIAAGEVMATLAWAPHVPLALDGAAADLVLSVDGTTVHEATAGAPVASVDAARRLVEVIPGDVLTTDAGCERAGNVGALATAAQILGAGYAVLDRATEYAQQRVQFGRPIGQFQAVKHQLADVLVGLELARPLLFGAALAFAGDSSTFGRDISAAKVACTDAAYRAARVSLQVHGAIGYTAEYDLALWLTKIRALTSAWGTQRLHRACVLQSLEAGR